MAKLRGKAGWRSRMRLGSSFLPLTTLAVCVAVVLGATGPAGAQGGRSMQIEDQPGYIPDAREERLSSAFQRQAVFYRTTEPPGTIIVDTADRYLYLVQGNNRAMRYGIGVGREGFQWQGLLKITRKSE